MVKFHLSINFALSHCLFGAAKLTKIACPDKCGYRDYVIGFNACSQFPLPKWGENVVISSVSNSLSEHTDNRKKYILVLGERLADGWDDTAITAEANIAIIC